MNTLPALHVRGIGLLGPGLPDWGTGQDALREPAGYVPARTVLAPPPRLQPAERRRAGASVKLSLAVADQACGDARIDPRYLATVFSASTGEAANCHALCEALASADRLVSPTRFTNSVHNAAAGYWHIATQSRAASTSLCGYDASFGAGLLEAASQCVVSREPVLLVACDVPYPEPLHASRPLTDAFAIALLLDAVAPERPVPRLRMRLDEAPVTRCANAALEALRQNIPAARGLPLLQALACRQSGELVLDYLEPLGLSVQVIAAGSP